MHLLIFGLGYSGGAVARLARTRGITTSATSREPEAAPRIEGLRVIPFADSGAAVAGATHVVSTIGPDAEGDPVLRAFGGLLASAPRLVWAGYMSTTGVYGDRGGAWVDEDTEIAPVATRSQARVEAEQGWAALSGRVPVDLFRTGGIYGPGRSPFGDIRAGRARRVLKPGQTFGRIHRDDIAAAILAAAMQTRDPAARVLHLVDDEPAENASVVAEAAALIGAPPPPSIVFEDAFASMTPMARSFWSESRKVSSAKTKRVLGLSWRYPTFREGLRAILAEERADRPHQ